MQAHVLGHEADVPLGFRLLAGIGWPSTRTVPPSGRIIAHDDPDRRRLARAVRADEPHDLSRLQAHADGRQPEEPVRLLDAVEIEDRLGHGWLSLPSLGCSRSCRLSRSPARRPARALSSRIARGQSELEADVDGRGEVRIELVTTQLRPEVGAVGDERSLALPRHDDPVALELEVGALDGDDADLHSRRKRPDRRDLLTRLPVPDRNAPPDLLHDLEIHGAAVGLGNDQITVHV